MEIPTPDEYFRRIHRMMQLLDEGNIRIVQAMKEYGPRNLQLIARKLLTPYPTLYSRVSRLSQEGLLRIWGMPDFEKIGLTRGVVLVNPLPGKDLLVREALKIPGYWIRHMRCVGDCNGYHFVQCVPTDHLREFEEYIQQLVPLGLASNCKINWLGHQHTFLPNFDYYDSQKKRWRFDWKEWLNLITSGPEPAVEDEIFRAASSHPDPVSFDSRDLYVVKELMKDARVSLADIARMFDITLPAAKYRFESVMKKGLVREFVFDILPYAPAVSDLYEVRFDFKNEAALSASERSFAKLPFVLNVSQMKGLTSLVARVYLPRGEMNNLITFMTALAQNGIITNFTYMWLDSATLNAQTFGFKKYREKGEWYYSNNDYGITLHNLLGSFGKEVLTQPAFEPMSPITA